MNSIQAKIEGREPPTELPQEENSFVSDEEYEFELVPHTNM